MGSGHMRKRAATLAVSIAVNLVLIVPAIGDVCAYKPPKVRRVCGTVVDPSGEPVAKAGIRLLRNGDVVVKTNADQHGEFDLEVREPGKYELDTTASGFVEGRYELTLQHPERSCKNALRVELFVPTTSTCGGNIMKTKTPLRHTQ